MYIYACVFNSRECSTRVELRGVELGDYFLFTQQLFGKSCYIFIFAFVVC